MDITDVVRKFGPLKVDYNIVKEESERIRNELWDSKWYGSNHGNRFELVMHARYLGLPFGILKSLNIDFSETSMVEFGASHHRLSGAPPWCPATAHYFLLNPKPPMSYFAFDPGFKIEHLENEIKSRENRNCNPKINMKKLIKETLKANLDSYDSAKRKTSELLSVGRIPVVFSSCVLTDYHTDMKSDFWHLPGLHVHFGDFEEMMRYIYYAYDKPKDDISMEDYVLEDWKKNPKKFCDAFRNSCLKIGDAPMISGTFNGALWFSWAKN